MTVQEKVMLIIRVVDLVRAVLEIVEIIYEWNN